MDDPAGALAARLRRLEAFEAARDLGHDYAAAADTRELAPVLALFAPAAVRHSPRGGYSGHEQIAESYTAGWTLEPSRKRHFVTNTRLGLEADGTVASSAYFFLLGRGTGRSVIGWGTYEDRIDVSGERPVFTEKRITLLMSTDLATGWPLDGAEPG